MIEREQEAIEWVQQHLAFGGYYTGKVDGIAGPATDRAIRAATATWDRKRLGVSWGWLGGKRLAVAYLQAWLQINGKADPGPVDGFLGPQTLYALDVWEGANLPFRGNEVQAKPEPGVKWPAGDEKSLRAFYGEPGKNLVRLDLPYAMRLAWDTDTFVNTIQCHVKVKDSLRGIFHDILEHYGPGRIAQLRLDHFGGCYNFRSKRNGTALSTHAWGIAVDIDPMRNQLAWGRDKAMLARAEYQAFWEIVNAHGWVGLGPAKNYDWQHVMAARV